MKLGQAETVGVFDDHDRGVGHVDADLDNRGGDQNGDTAVCEVGHDRFALSARHLAVGQSDLHVQQSPQIIGAVNGGGEVDGFGFATHASAPSIC